MNTADHRAPDIHQDEIFFREAVGFTAARTGFSQRLIEKDYFCTVLLARLVSDGDSALVFKGGTCLAKVHAEFYRMSEDLDFVIPVATTCRRSERSRRVSIYKDFLDRSSTTLPEFRITEPLRGANESRQYICTISYDSTITQREETIKIEIALREPMLTTAAMAQARTALLDPISAQPLLPTVPIMCISVIEAFAEKFRAALTRREVAIRDFYDIDFGVTNLGIKPEAPELVELVRQKIAIPGNNEIDTSTARLTALENQLNTRLKPVLRQDDFTRFDLDRAKRSVIRLAELVRKPQRA